MAKYSDEEKKNYCFLFLRLNENEMFSLRDFEKKYVVSKSALSSWLNDKRYVGNVVYNKWEKIKLRNIKLGISKGGKCGQMVLRKRIEDEKSNLQNTIVPKSFDVFGLNRAWESAHGTTKY